MNNHDYINKIEDNKDIIYRNK